MIALDSQHDARRQMLHELFASATHDASAAMCRWTGGPITLGLDEVREVPLEEVCDVMDVGDEMMTMAILTASDEIGGQMILAFDEAGGRRLAGFLWNREPGEGPEWEMLEQSALGETGNILGCAYLNALARLIHVELIPSPPVLVKDYLAGVLQQALLPQAMSCDELVVCRTVFRHADETLDWRVFFVPTHAMRQRIEEAIRVRN